MKFFQKIRRSLLTENKFSKYLLYAIGEIILVVIGILVAVELNNQNELRKQKVVEIEVLEGLREDLLKDTLDLAMNIRIYKKETRLDSMLLDTLINGWDKTENLVEYMNRICYNDLGVSLHTSHFEETKLKGLSIISNAAIREEINHLYEFDYKSLSFFENESERYNYTHLLRKNLQPYFAYDSSGIVIKDEAYRKLLNDDNAFYHIEYARACKKLLLKKHLNSMALALTVAEKISKEIERLKAL